jgi:RNA polymerase sigma factor (sigma-70 family)
MYRIDRADAEELVSDVLLLVASRIVGFEFKKADSDFRSWVLTILRNRARDYLRRTSADRHPMASLDDQVIPDDSFLRAHDDEVTISIIRGLGGRGHEVHDLFREHEKVSQLKEILETMPVWEQVLLRCRALDIPYEEIATYTGKPASVLKVYHRRVQKKIRKKIETQFPHFLAEKAGK